MFVSSSRGSTAAHVVDVVEDADAGLLLAALPLLPVVRLPLLEAARVAPLAEGAAPGGRDPLAGGRPVPTVHDGRLEVFPLTALVMKCRSSICYEVPQYL